MGKTATPDLVGSAAIQTQPDFADLIERIRRGVQNGEEDLYEIMRRGLRFLALRYAGASHADDHVHNAYIAIVNQIRRGMPRDPATLLGFARTILIRTIVSGSDSQYTKRRLPWLESGLESLADSRKSPEQIVLDNERIQQMAKALKRLRPSEREILTRFYLRHQTRTEICEAMQLTSTQFRLRKSRAKQKLEPGGSRPLGFPLYVPRVAS